MRASASAAESPAPACRIVGKSPYTPKGFRWLGLQRIEWQGPDGRSRWVLISAGVLETTRTHSLTHSLALRFFARSFARFWESVERQTTVKDAQNVEGADAVAVVAKASGRGRDSAKMLIIKQFRPPVGGHVLELPAGLIDPGETPSQAACRELKEECGYTATVSSVSPLVYNDPGITNANMLLAVVDVDLVGVEYWTRPTRAPSSQAPTLTCATGRFARSPGFAGEPRRRADSARRGVYRVILGAIWYGFNSIQLDSTRFNSRADSLTR